MKNYNEVGGKMKIQPKKLLILVLSTIIVVTITIWFIIPIIKEHKKSVTRRNEWTTYLKEYPSFSSRETGYELDVNYYYSDQDDSSLVKLRELFKLDSIAGGGSEIDRIINLMTWVYQLTGHENEPVIPEPRNAFTFIQMAQVEQKQINCYMKTVILNEVYLSMGFFSRYTHLLPYSEDEPTSHYITSVFSKTLDKWILMDPDFGVYVTNKQGELLGVDEIRSSLISGEPLKSVHVGRSDLKLIWTNFTNWIEGTDYFWFLSWHIFKIRCPINSMFGQDSESIRVYYELIPDNYKVHLLKEPRLTDRGKKIYSMNDKYTFWQNPQIRRRATKYEIHVE